MKKIPGHIITEVLQKTNVIELISPYTQLHQKGQKYFGLCPFHNEKTPSFSVDAEKGLFYCFGCQKGGTAIQFIMEIEKLTFPEALTALAKKAGVQLISDGRFAVEDAKKESLYELYQRLSQTFHWFLLSHFSGKPALQKLEERRISNQIIAEYCLGYAPADKNWLYSFLLKKGYSKSFIAESGLFSSRNETFPLFSDRLIFPIADVQGRIIGFGGRLMQGEGPKYLNSPETMLFKKQENLYPIHKSYAEIKRTKVAIICEGYMDALAFHSSGLCNALAPLGTAFTSYQADRLRKLATQVIICLDSDTAGIHAAEKFITTATKANLEVSVVLLSGAKDPAELFETQGPEVLRKTMKSAISTVDFLVKRAKELYDISSVEGKSQVIMYIAPFASAHVEEYKRDLFLGECAQKLGLDAKILSKAETSLKLKAFSQSRLSHEIRKSHIFQGARTADIQLMTALFLYSQYFATYRSQITVAELCDYRARDMYYVLEEAFREEQCDFATLLSRLEEESRHLILQASATEEFSIDPVKLIKDCIKAIQIATLEKRIKQVQLQIYEISVLAKKEDVHTLHAGLTNLLSEKKILDHKLEEIKSE